MTPHPVDVVTRTLLYEGYLLYPYRSSAIKNQQRFNFGVLYPESWCVAWGAAGTDRWRIQMECPALGAADTRLSVAVRFLQVFDSAAGRTVDAPLAAIEREAAMREVTVGELLRAPASMSFGLPAIAAASVAGDETSAVSTRPESDGFIQGRLQLTVAEVRPATFRLTIHVDNLTSFDASGANRHDVLERSLVSVHVIVRTFGGELVSLLDPPEALRDVTASCTNDGVWPVLVGDDGSRDCMLASPIILYDYPAVAPESAGDLFDGTEIDEILALRILTMTDDEKRQVREGDQYARQILERTEALPPEQWAKLHGAVRGLRRVQQGTS